MIVMIDSHDCHIGLGLFFFSCHRVQHSLFIYLHEDHWQINLQIEERCVWAEMYLATPWEWLASLIRCSSDYFQ
jgi:hypothetical protein